MSAAEKASHLCATEGCYNLPPFGERWCTSCRKVASARGIRRRPGLGWQRVQEAPGAASEQLGLLGDPPAAAPAPLGSTRLPRARNTDPAESHLAAGKAARGLTDKQRHVLSVFRLRKGGLTLEELVQEYGALRQEQLARGYGAQLPDLTASSIRTRASELVTAGHLTKVGERASARGNPSAVLDLA